MRELAWLLLVLGIAWGRCRLSRIVVASSPSPCLTGVARCVYDHHPSCPLTALLFVEMLATLPALERGRLTGGGATFSAFSLLALGKAR